MDNQERIARFTKMAEADPDNELGHYSLGKALVEEARFGEAVPSLQRVIELNPEYSRAYQILALAQSKLEQGDAALATLRTGIGVADRRGDKMPRDEMAKLMTDLGETPPAPAAEPVATATISGDEELVCSRCGRPSERMQNRPFKGELGERVWGKVCQGCWREWVSAGTKVINEMGLQLSDPRAQQMYDEHMVEFLQIDR